MIVIVHAKSVTCPGCHPTVALLQLGEAPADTLTLISARSGHGKTNEWINE